MTTRVPVISDAVLARAEAEVVPLLQQMVALDTTIADHDDPPRQDREHQELIASYLREIGAEVELVEPGSEEFRDHPMYRPGQTFAGRPILWARIPGDGGGRSLLFNGHFDTVVADPVADWTHGPWSGDVSDGKLYGRGSCDMKGGIACALAMAAALVAEGVKLPGDLLFNVAPFEEVNGMGTTATMLRGYRADAAVCCEPTELNTLIACRGVLLGRLAIEGRSAHAEIIQPHHSEGGGVNAIDKLIDVLAAIRVLNEDWRSRPDKQHWLLSTPSVLTTMTGGGAFASNWPAEAWAVLNCCYVPGEADDAGYGSRVMREIEERIDAAAAGDGWLRDHRPAVEWLCDFPPGELDRDHELVRSASASARRQGATESRLIGFDTWADQVMLMKEGGIPAVCLGPGSIGRAHAVDEFVPVADLAACTRIYADLAANWTAGVPVDPATRERPEETPWPR
jgi:acetylornithine deacetylase